MENKLICPNCGECDWRETSVIASYTKHYYCTKCLFIATKRELMGEEPEEY